MTSVKRWQATTWRTWVALLAHKLAIMPDLGFERPDGPNTIVVARILRWLSGAAQTENALSDAIGDGL